MTAKEKTDKEKYKDGTYLKLFKEILNHYPNPDAWEEILKKETSSSKANKNENNPNKTTT